MKNTSFPKHKKKEETQWFFCIIGYVITSSLGSYQCHPYPKNQYCVTLSYNFISFIRSWVLSLVQPYSVNLKREFEETRLHHLDQGETTCFWRSEDVEAMHYTYAYTTICFSSYWYRIWCIWLWDRYFSDTTMSFHCVLLRYIHWCNPQLLKLW